MKNVIITTTFLFISSLGFSQNKTAVDIPQTHPDSLSTIEDDGISISTIPSGGVRILKGDSRTNTTMRYPSRLSNHNRIAAKTNVLYLATMSPNLGFEMAMSHKWTWELTAGYNLFKYGGNTYLRHFLVKPEFRYWPCRAFEGHFFGAHGLYSRFNVGEIPIPNAPIKDHSYKGYMYGGGLTYGYHYPLGKRWGLEMAVGVGYLRIEYDKIRKYDECQTCMGKRHDNYFGPTKLGLSLVYMIR